MLLDYAHQRAIEALGEPRTAVLVTNGPAGIQVREFPCEMRELDLYLLVPRTSDHLFNLEHESRVTLLTVSCEIRGRAHLIDQGALNLELGLCEESAAAWCALVRVEISQVQIQSARGWGNLETIDL